MGQSKDQRNDFFKWKYIETSGPQGMANQHGPTFLFVHIPSWTQCRSFQDADEFIKILFKNNKNKGWEIQGFWVTVCLLNKTCGIRKSIVYVSMVEERVFQYALIFLSLTFVDCWHNICFLKDRKTLSSNGLTRTSVVTSELF